MEIILFAIIWMSLGGLFAMILLTNDPYVKARKLADIEILKHKWLESEKAGHDIGMESAEKSWSKNHARKWRKANKH
jgi:hypothetical protein